MNKFSHSRISTFRQCNRRYYYQYVEGIETKTPEALLLGQLFHEILEYHYDDKDVQPVIDKYINFIRTGELETPPDLMEHVYHEYLKHYKKQMAEEELLFNEQKFEIAFDEDEEDIMTGVVDKIIRVGSTVILRDHKTTSGSLKYSPEQVRYNPQQLLYKDMAEMLTKVEIDAVEIDEIRLAILLPDVPLNRDGKPTVDIRRLANITYEMYHNKLVELGLEDDPDFEYILSALEKRGHPLFRRTIVSMTDPIVNRTNLKDIEATMKQIKKEKVFPRNPGRLCDYCPFREICNFDYYEPSPMDREIIKRKMK